MTNKVITSLHSDNNEAQGGNGMNKVEQDELLHMQRLNTDIAYAEWSESFRCHWHEQGFSSSGDIPHSFIIELFDAGYAPDEAFELFKIADAESFARRREQEEIEAASFTMTFEESVAYLQTQGYIIEPYHGNENKVFVESPEHIWAATKHDVAKHAMELR